MHLRYVNCNMKRSRCFFRTLFVLDAKASCNISFLFTYFNAPFFILRNCRLSFVAPIEKISLHATLDIYANFQSDCKINNSFWDESLRRIESGDKAGTAIFSRLVAIFQIGSKLFLIPTYIHLSRLRSTTRRATNYFLTNI